MEERINANLKDLAKGIDAKEKYVIVAEFPTIDYTLVYRPTEFEPWIAAWAFNKEKGSWGQGHCFDTITKAMKHIFMMTDKITFLRMEEIASKTIDKLIEEDPYEAEEFLREELDLDDDEVEYFGIGETLDMVKGYDEWKAYEY